MRVVFVASETWLWKPKYLERLITEGGVEFTGVVSNSFRPTSTSRLNHLRRHLTVLGLFPFILLGAVSAAYLVRGVVLGLLGFSASYGIASVAKRHGIPLLHTKDVNDPSVIKWISDRNPDVIISSGNQIFKKDILGVFPGCCINRHSSLLPSYKGIYPAFWALLNGERESGTSVHLMVEEIDKGKVIAQEVVPILETDSFISLFHKCYEKSYDVTVAALAKLEAGDRSEVKNDLSDSYYSYPSPSDKRQFIRCGKKIMNFRDIPLVFDNSVK